MTDSKTIQDERDRSKVSLEDEYEISYLASKLHLSIDQVRDLVERFGPDREAVEAEGRKLG